MSLQKRSGGQNVFGNACGSSRKSRGIYRDVCASRASTTVFTETFAQAAQVPRHLPRRLRKPRKYHGIYRDVCAGRASPAAFTETFAQIAQVLRHLPRRLRRLRKSCGICFGVCGTFVDTLLLCRDALLEVYVFPEAVFVPEDCE